MMRIRIAAVAVVLLLFPAIAVQAEEPAALKTKLSAGFTLTDGNSETLLANASLLTEGEKRGLGSLRAGIEFNYGESTVDDRTETTVNNTRLFGNARKTITPLTFGYLDLSLLQDDIAEIDYRFRIGPGLGAYLTKNDSTALSVEAGPAQVWEKVAGERDDYIALRFSERFDHALGASAKIWQSLEFLPMVEDFGDYLLSAELGAEAAMTERLNLRVVLKDDYDSEPGEGVKRNDLSLIAGISVVL